jgi:hypothetical protein
LKQQYIKDNTIFERVLGARLFAVLDNDLSPALKSYLRTLADDGVPVEAVSGDNVTAVVNDAIAEPLKQFALGLWAEALLRGLGEMKKPRGRVREFTDDEIDAILKDVQSWEDVADLAYTSEARAYAKTLQRYFTKPSAGLVRIGVQNSYLKAARVSGKTIQFIQDELQAFVNRGASYNELANRFYADKEIALWNKSNADLNAWSNIFAEQTAVGVMNQTVDAAAKEVGFEWGRSFNPDDEITSDICREAYELGPMTRDKWEKWNGGAYLPGQRRPGRCRCRMAWSNEKKDLL